MQFKEIAGELFPWEEEEKRKKPKRMDSIPPRTSLKSNVHSKPRVEGQEYLELYLMAKEKERLEKFGEVMGKIQKQTAEGWKDVKKEIAKAEKTLPPMGDMVMKVKEGGGAGEEKKRVPKKPLNKVPLNY